jgi:hypothetical protein
MTGDQEAGSVDDWGFRSLKDDILQHMLRNDDWCNRDLLERLSLMRSSRSLFFRFLEACIPPLWTRRRRRPGWSNSTPISSTTDTA